MLLHCFPNHIISSLHQKILNLRIALKFPRSFPLKAKNYFVEKHELLTTVGIFQIWMKMLDFENAVIALVPHIKLSLF